MKTWIIDSKLTAHKVMNTHLRTPSCTRADASVWNVLVRGIGGGVAKITGRLIGLSAKRQIQHGLAAGAFQRVSARSLALSPVQFLNDLWVMSLFDYAKLWGLRLASTKRDHEYMPASKRKRPADFNQLAKSILDDSTAEEEPVPNPAVERGRLGGQKGGKARANKLTPEQRSEIARLAAAARWRKSS